MLPVSREPQLSATLDGYKSTSTTRSTWKPRPRVTGTLSPPVPAAALTTPHSPSLDASRGGCCSHAQRLSLLPRRTWSPCQTLQPPLVIKNRHHLVLFPSPCIAPSHSQPAAQREKEEATGLPRTSAWRRERRRRRRWKGGRGRRSGRRRICLGRLPPRLLPDSPSGAAAHLDKSTCSSIHRVLLTGSVYSATENHPQTQRQLQSARLGGWQIKGQGTGPS